MLSGLADLGLGGGYVTIRHPAHRSSGGEWDALDRLPQRVKRSLTGARILTPKGLPPDVAAMHVGANLGTEMTPDELAHWLQTVAYPAIAESRTARVRAQRLRYAIEQGAPTYYAMRDGYAVVEGYRSLWDKRRTIWNG